MDTQSKLSAQLQQMMAYINQNHTTSQTNITQHLNDSKRTFGDISSKLGLLEKTAQNMHELGKDISSIQNILKAPTFRGGLGEQLLEELLKQILPSENYEFQYSFRNGTKVDAIIRLGDYIVPIDSKFPLESFQRFVIAENEDEKKAARKEFVKVVKKHIDSISEKYINPSEGTFNFAMMYIPAENIFYEILVNSSLVDKDDELFNHARNKHIIPVSPNSFYAYLMAISFGLKGLKIEQDAKIIRDEISQLSIKFGKFYEDYGVVGKHLGNAVSKYSETTKSADKLNDQINRITGQRTELIDS
jgi:DNA recombination protein RmuC